MESKYSKIIDNYECTQALIKESESCHYLALVVSASASGIFLLCSSFEGGILSVISYLLIPVAFVIPVVVYSLIGGVPGNLLDKLVAYLLSFVPLYVEVVTKTSINPIKAIIFVPALLIFALIATYAFSGDSRPLSPQEYRFISNMMKQGGVDPRKIGLIHINSSNYKEYASISPQEWRHVGLLMKQGGIDVMKGSSK